MPQILYYIIISPIEMFIESAYSFLSVTVRHNPGFAIIGISFLVSLCCLPLYAKAELLQEEERTLRKKMARRTASIKKYFRGDEQYMILSMYYRENHYHPLMALRGSLSLLVQIPFFIAAYSFLSHNEDLKGQSLLIIQNLGMPDALISLGTLRINALPLVMTAINIISGAVYTRGFPLRERVQLYLMALVFLVLLYPSPSALVLYWTCNNIFSLIKNLVFKTKHPLRVLYGAVIAVLAAACVYVFFFRSQGRSGSFLFKTAAIGVSAVIAGIPLYIRAFNAIGKKHFALLKNMSGDMRLLFLTASSAAWLLCGIVIPFNVIASDPAAFSFLGGGGRSLSNCRPVHI